MSRLEDRAEDRDMFRFVLTLIVTTLIAAVTIFVLGAAVLDPRANGGGHRSAVATLHAHT
jgi:hypothetical protein